VELTFVIACMSRLPAPQELEGKVLVTSCLYLREEPILSPIFLITSPHHSLVYGRVESKGLVTSCLCLSAPQTQLAPRHLPPPAAQPPGPLPTRRTPTLGLKVNLPRKINFKTFLDTHLIT